MKDKISYFKQTKLLLYSQTNNLSRARGVCEECANIIKRKRSRRPNWVAPSRKENLLDEREDYVQSMLRHTTRSWRGLIEAHGKT